MKNAERVLSIALLTGLLSYAAPVAAAREASPAMNLARQLNEAFIEVVDRASPAVVVVMVMQKVDAGGEGSQEGSQFWKFLPDEFRRQLEERFKNEGQKPKGQHPLVPAQGSGVVVREDGFIVTNRHVVEGAEKIKVRFKDGKEYEAEVRGLDAQSDIAVLKIKASGLPVLQFADSAKVRVGEFAIAIGAPFELDYSVTVGHVSAKGRSNIVPPWQGGQSMDQDFIQTDASINPGNSGGPLVNIDGEIIGINTMIRGLNTGIGFAVPGSLAREVSDKLIANGKYVRAWLGLEIRALKEDEDYRGLVKGVEEGVVVRGIRKDGPAAKSDLKPGDIVTAVDGHKVADAQQFRQAVRAKEIGSTVSLDVVRNGKPQRIKVKTDGWPEADSLVSNRKSTPQTAESEDLGLTVRAMTRDLAKEIGVEMTEGVVVTDVEAGGAAARKGLQAGDVITEINQQSVATLKDYREALKGADLKKGVLVNLMREGVDRLVVLKDAGE